jgi:integrase
MPTRFTDFKFKSLKPKAARYEYPVGAGLYVSVQPSGAKRFVGRYKSPVTGKNSKYTFQAGLALAGVNTLWADFKLALSKKVDPAIEEKAKAEAEAAAKGPQPDVVTLRSVIQRYFRDPHVLALRSAHHSEMMMGRNVTHKDAVPALGERPINSIRRHELITLQDNLIASRGARTADMTLKILSRIFGWWVLRDPTEQFFNPIVKGMFKYSAKEHRRKRVLTEPEIKALWTATTEPTPYNRLLRFLLATAARREEACQMTWDEILPEGDLWTLPEARNKVREELKRPLSKLARSILAECPRVEGERYVFPSSEPGKPFNDHSRAKIRLDEKLQFGKSWQIHDLRRSARTLLSQCKVPGDICELCLGHVLPPIRATYDGFDYEAAKKEAFDKLGELIEGIINPPPEAPPADNVRQFRKRKAA